MSSRRMQRNWVLIGLLVLVMAGGPVFSGSFLDTIQGAADGGQGTAAPPPAAIDEPAPADDGAAVPEERYACGAGVCGSGVCGGGTCGQPMTGERLQELIQRLIQAIMGACGNGQCGGVRIIIIRCPGGMGGQQPTTPPQPTQPPAEPTQPTQPPPTANDQQPGATDIAGLQAEIRSKFGIDCRNGDSARGWSVKQLQAARDVFAKLPKAFYGHCKSVVRDGVYRSPGVLGYVQMGIPTVHMMDSSTYEGTFQGTLVHEMAHTWQANNGALTREWQSRWWSSGRPNPSSVSSYGNTQPVEDMAESVRQYFQAGSRMKQSHPDRYEWIKRNVMAGVEF